MVPGFNGWGDWSEEKISSVCQGILKVCIRTWVWL
jgi:hypothetical protein